MLADLDEGGEHAYASWVRSRLHVAGGDFAAARREAQQTLEIARRVGDRDSEALALLATGFVDMGECRFDAGSESLEDAGALATLIVAVQLERRITATLQPESDVDQEVMLHDLQRALVAAATPRAQEPLHARRLTLARELPEASDDQLRRVLWGLRNSGPELQPGWEQILDGVYALRERE